MYIENQMQEEETLKNSSSIAVLELYFKDNKNDKKWFLFHIKSSFRSWDVYIFALKFWLHKKMAW